MKQVTAVVGAPRGHWVGDGFPVRSMFDYQGLGQELSPFLLLDYASPSQFAPAAQPRGVGQHPHRGFETVTIVYQGEVAHRDSTGQGGVIGPGDVQWMTAGAGIVHEEFHSEAFTRHGGWLQMAQLWVNLPAKDKMTAPAYQAIVDADIPRVALAGGAGQARVIAGQWGDARGPAHTFSPLQVVDLTLHAGHTLTLPAHDGWTTALVVLSGAVRVNGAHAAQEAQLVVMSTEGGALQLDVDADAKVLWLSGEPLGEPVVGHGPFVMNSMAEIRQAIVDFNAGKFGRVDH